jgi:hypothetical protein
MPRAALDGVALKGLTVDFHEPGFLGQVAGENQKAFWFQLSEEEEQKAGNPWGPVNPQALNRYSYVQNNPIRYVDPKGHETYSWGITIRGGGILGGSVSFGIITDDKGGFGLFSARSGGVEAGAIFCASMGYAETAASTIADARGPGKAIGFDYLIIGGDHILTSDGKYIGSGASIGPGIGADVHVKKPIHPF